MIDEHAAAALSAVCDELGAESPSDGPGLAVAVHDGGQFVLSRAWGLARLLPVLPFVVDTPCQTGSLAKLFTAAAVARLIASDALDLETPIVDLVPELQPSAAGVRIRHLVYHTSGIRDYIRLGSLAGRADDGADRVLSLLARQLRTDFQPGSEFSYSNSGYFLLALLVERRSGTPFPTFMHREFFGPLGMNHTRFVDAATVSAPDTAYGYRRSPETGSYQSVQPRHTTFGNGGLWTTVRDLGSWNGWIATQSALDNPFVRLMNRVATLDDGAPIRAGFGCYLRMLHGHRLFVTPGDYAGYRAVTMRVPQSGASVSVIANSADRRHLFTAWRLLDAYLWHVLGENRSGASTPLPAEAPSPIQEPPPVSLSTPPFDPDACTGAFRSEELDATYHLHWRDGTLLLVRPRRADELWPSGEADRLLVRFLRDPACRVTGFELDAHSIRGLRFIRSSSPSSPRSATPTDSATLVLAGWNASSASLRNPDIAVFVLSP